MDLNNANLQIKIISPSISQGGLLAGWADDYDCSFAEHCPTNFQELAGPFTTVAEYLRDLLRDLLRDHLREFRK